MQESKGQGTGGERDDEVDDLHNDDTPMSCTKHPTTKKCPTQRPSKTKKPTPATTTEVPSSTPRASHSPSTGPSASLSPSSSICAGTVLFPTNGHWYLLAPRSLDYVGTVEYTSSLPPCCGGKLTHIVTIADVAENNCTVQVLAQSGAEKGFIGYDNLRVKAMYECVTGKPTTYTSWAQVQFCATLTAKDTGGGGVGLWIDLITLAALSLVTFAPSWSTTAMERCPSP